MIEHEIDKIMDKEGNARSVMFGIVHIWSCGVPLLLI